MIKTLSLDEIFMSWMLKLLERQGVLIKAERKIVPVISGTFDAVF